MGKNHIAETGILDHVAYNRSNLWAPSWDQLRMEPPGKLAVCFHSQPEQLCSVHLLRHTVPMSRIQTPWGQTGDRKDPLRGVRRDSRDPSAGVQHEFESLGKLKLRQGLLIPWYHEDKDCDYLRVPLAGALPASAESPSSNLGSFAGIMSALL